MKNNLKLKHLTEDEMLMLRDYLKDNGEAWIEVYLISVSQDEIFTGNNLEIAFIKQRVIDENICFFEEWKDKEINQDEETLKDFFQEAYVYECRRRFKESLNERLLPKNTQDKAQKI